MEQGITFTIPKAMIEIIPFNSSTLEKRIFEKLWLVLKRRISSDFLVMYDDLLCGIILNR